MQAVQMLSEQGRGCGCVDQEPGSYIRLQIITFVHGTERQCYSNIVHSRNVPPETGTCTMELEAYSGLREGCHT